MKPVRESYIEEDSLLEEVRRAKPRACWLSYPNWNEAVSMQARLHRAIKNTAQTFLTVYPADHPDFGKNPYEGLAIHVHQPGRLRFSWTLPQEGDKPRIRIEEPGE
jgi:hypothetical protein